MQKINLINKRYTIENSDLNHMLLYNNFNYIFFNLQGSTTTFLMAEHLQKNKDARECFSATSLKHKFKLDQMHQKYALNKSA